MMIHYKPYKIVNPKKSNNFIILCDHALYNIPKKYKKLGLSNNNLKKHIGWDIGALKVAKKISKNINSTLIYSGYSRLLIDCNRALKSKGAFLKKSENINIPGNFNISRKEKILRSKRYYFPYHNQIKKFIQDSLKNNIVPSLVSIHSFTPVYLGKARKWHIGILQRSDQRLSSLFIKEIRKYKKITLGINEPYKLDLSGDFTIPFFSETYGLPNVLIEIRQDLLTKDHSINFWSNLITKILKKNFKNESLKYCLKPSNRISKYYQEKNNL